MKRLLAIVVLFALCLIANAEQKTESNLTICVAVRGTNVTYVLDGRVVPRDHLFHQLNRIAVVSKSVHIVLYADPKTPVGVLHDLYQDIVKTELRARA